MDLRSLEIKIARSENLPVLPQIVSSVLKIADDPNASSRAMEKIIERDPGITAKILRVASSSYYGGAAVPTIGRGISMLGLNSVRSLVVGVAYQQMMNTRQLSSSFSRSDFWRHCLAVAIAARVIGKIKCPAKAEELYCAGMLHDVGMLVMDRFLPAELDEAIKMAQDEQLPFYQAENLMFKVDHSQIGDLLATRWNLPPLLRNAIRYHHDVCEDETQMLTTCVVSLADSLAHRCGFTNTSPTASYEHDSMALKTLDISVEQLDVIQPVIVSEVVKAEESFGF